MYFTLSKSLFGVEEIDVSSLNKIWAVNVDQHTFYQNDEDDIDATMKSAWYKGLSDADKDVYHQSIIASMQMAGITRDIVRIGDDYSPAEAYSYLSQPLQLIVENSLNDAPFLASLFKCFKKESVHITKHMDERWLQLTMGGGSSIRQVIQTTMRSYTNQIFSKAKHKYLRCFVLLDSDKTYKTEPYKIDLAHLMEFLERHEVSYHILEKREMENYLPDEALEEIQSSHKFIEAYLGLNDEQKDFMDLEKGFQSKTFEKLPEGIKSLYSDLSLESKAIFRRNNLKKLISSDKDDFKAEFPKLFATKYVTKESLLKRTSNQSNPHELKDIIRKIRELL